MTSREMPSGNSSSRERIALSVSPHMDMALSQAALVLGMSKSQVALQAMMNGLPKLMEQILAVSTLIGPRGGK